MAVVGGDHEGRWWREVEVTARGARAGTVTIIDLPVILKDAAMARTPVARCAAHCSANLVVHWGVHGVVHGVVHGGVHGVGHGLVQGWCMGLVAHCVLHDVALFGRAHARQS